jgi:hypothetical protein
MTVVAVVLIVIAAIAVFAIAAVVIGREARRLDTVAPRTVYLLDEAVEFVADHLPPESQARLTHDEVRELLVMHMRRLHDKGLQPTGVVDHVQDIDLPVVVDEMTDGGYLIGQAEQAGLSIDDVDVLNVIEAHLEYLDAIGAIGPRADDPDVAT